jgi:hypothetical protein
MPARTLLYVNQYIIITLIIGFILGILWLYLYLRNYYIETLETVRRWAGIALGVARIT